MPLPLANILALLVEAWILLGLVAAAALWWRGLAQLDPTTHSGGLGFKLVLLPGMVLLWPLLLWFWFTGSRPTDRSAHLDASRVQ